MKKLVLSVMVLLVSQFANGESLSINPDKVVIVAGEIYDLSDESNKLLEIAVPMKDNLTNKDVLGDAAASPIIDIILESPGGSVFAGNVFLNAMHVAQGRGYKLRCIVPAFAASMAFIIFTYCDERYALPNSLLLFHPISRGVMGRVNEEVLSTMILQMKLLSEDIDAHIKKVMGINDKDYAHLNNKEVFFTGTQLKKLAKEGFMKIPSEIHGVDKLFSLKEKGGMINKSINKYKRK